MSKPIPISAKCTTYGRVEFLEEALQSFLMLEYNGDYELLIVNDYPLQTLHFDHPKVRIINLKETFPMIGEKEDFAISQCKYDCVLNFDDDDVVLFNQLQNVNKYFPGHQLLHWNLGIAMVGNEIAAIKAIGNCGIAYDKKFVKEKLGTFYPIEHEGADMSLVKAIKKHGGKVARAFPPGEEVSQVYNWGNGSYHLSGQGKYHEGQENIIIRHSRHIEQLRKQGKIPTGDIELKPHWKRDYKKMLHDFLTCSEPVDIHGRSFKVLPDNREAVSIWKLINKKQWEPALYNFIKESKDNGVFWDTGAWIGPITLFASRQFRKVVSFEPDTVSLKRLKMNVNLNNLNNVHIIDKAMFKSCTMLDLGYNGKLGFGSSMASLNYDSDESCAVRTITMEQAIETYGRPDFVKIDIEGGEEYLMEGLLKHKFSRLFLSVHPKFIKDIDSFNSKLKTLSEHYNIRKIRDDYFMVLK